MLQTRSAPPKARVVAIAERVRDYSGGTWIGAALRAFNEAVADAIEGESRR